VDPRVDLDNVQLEVNDKFSPMLKSEAPSLGLVIVGVCPYTALDYEVTKRTSDGKARNSLVIIISFPFRFAVCDHTDTCSY
jgi:hypothetical protein